MSNPGTDFQSSGYLEFTLVNQVAMLDNVTDQVTVTISRAGMPRMESTLGRAFSDNTVGTGTGSTAP